MDSSTVWRARSQACRLSKRPSPRQLGHPLRFHGPRPALAPPSQPQAKNVTLQSGPRQEFRHQSVEHITNGLGNLKTGAGGTPIQLISNYFPITTYTDWRIYQYQVDFNPVQDMINIQRDILSAHRDLLGPYIFDGTMLFSSKKYKPATLELTSKRQYDDEIVIITIKFTSILEKGDYASIQIFNSLFCKSLEKLNLTLIGRNCYEAEAKIHIPKFELQLWPGFETTIGMYDSGLLLQSEISTKVMRKDTVLDFLKECAENKARNPQWMVQFKTKVIGSVVLTRYNNQMHRIDDVDEDSNTQSTFHMEDGSTISYMDYYKQKYGINLSSYSQPILVSKKKKSFFIDGDEFELVHLIPELCSLTGITNAMRKNHCLMANIAKHKIVGLNERIGRYNSLINRILTLPESAESLTQWNLTLSNKLVTIPGRVLSQETLQGNNHTFPAGNEATWIVHLSKSPMFACAEIQCWAVLCHEENGGEVRQFVKTLLQVAKSMSFNLPPPKIVYLKDTNIRMYLTALDQVINQMSPSFILCVLSTLLDDNHIIKRKLCIDRPVPSQVVLLKQVQKNNMSVCVKIAILINCKLGGAPWRVVIPEKNMMIVGFDVFHDRQNKNKSYSALIATMNDTHTTYFSCVQQHESGQELSSYFAMSIAKALNKYKSKNNTLPNSIIIYKNSVDDRQLSLVQRVEVDMVKKTCQDFYGEKKVGLAFIIVKKNLNTRFFCNNSSGYQNPPPGTVIDNTVTDPTMYDFYLISQNVTKGAVEPTHYNVIWNTLNETTATNFTPEIIQKLTYKLTHLFYSWSGTVKVPGPCLLAYKLAYFSSQILKNPANNSLEDLLYFL